MSEMMVSICMITYNHEPFIREAIEGVLMQQTNFPYELVIGEDCSTDRTREICIEYQQKHPDKIRLLLNENNLGMMPNFIQTLNACSGKYIALCEGDDYWTDPMKLQKQVEFLEKQADYILVGHNALILKQNSETNFISENLKDEDIDISQILVNGPMLSTCSILLRNNFNRDEIELLNKFELGDWIIVLLMARKGKIKRLDDFMAVYRIHEKGTYSPLDSKSKKNILIRFQQSIIEHFPEYKFFLKKVIVDRKKHFGLNDYSLKALINGKTSISTYLYGVRVKIRIRSRLENFIKFFGI